MELIEDIAADITADVEPVGILRAQFASIAEGLIALGPAILVALVVLLVTGALVWGVHRGIERSLRNRRRIRTSLKRLLANLAGILVWFLGIMVAAIILFPGLTPSSLVAGLGIGSVAIGFAFKDIFENFLAGIIILFRAKMRIGDYIECEGLKGQIEDILVRETHIRQTDGQLVIVPNAMLFQNPLTILTDLDERRITIIVGIAYGEDVDEGRAVIKSARWRRAIPSSARAARCRSSRPSSTPPPSTSRVTWWTGSSPVDERRSRDEVVASVKHALDAAGIEIPFPYRTLTFKEPLSFGAAGRRGRRARGVRRGGGVGVDGFAGALDRPPRWRPAHEAHRCAP